MTLGKVNGVGTSDEEVCGSGSEILASVPQLTVLCKMPHLPTSAGLSSGKFFSLKSLDLSVEGEGKHISQGRQMSNYV